MRRQGPDLLVASPVADRDNFFANASVAGPDDCWPWLRDGASAKYPRYRVGENLVHVQQVAWQFDNDEPADSQRIASTCGDGLCVNPKHLMLVDRTVPEGLVACPANPDSVYMGKDGVLLWFHGPHPGEVGEEGMNEEGASKCKTVSVRLGSPGVAGDMAEAIRQRRRAGALNADIQREFRVSPSEMNAIISRQAVAA